MTSSISNSEENGCRRVPSRFPWALLIAISIVAGVELLAQLNFERVARWTPTFPADRVPSLSDTIVDSKLEKVSQSNLNYDVIVLGDSSGLMGIDSKELSYRLGKTVTNLCTIGWLGVRGHNILLERYLKSNLAPDTIIYHFAPTTMTRTEESIRDLGSLSQIEQQFGRTTHLLPSQNYRDIARSLIVPEFVANQLAQVPRGPWASHREVLRILEQQDGCLQEQTRNDWATSPEMEAIGDITRFQHDGIQQLIELSRQKNIQLFIVSNPIPEISNSPVNRSALQGLERSLLKLAAEHDHVHVHQPFQRYIPNKMCATQNHLAPEAISMNTSTIAAWLIDNLEAEPHPIMEQ